MTTRVTTWADPWGVGIYGQQWPDHFQVVVALLWWSLIIEFVKDRRKIVDVVSERRPNE